MTNFAIPPEDLLIEILSWFPVTSLLRFRCVCKSWLNLIKSPKFINKHLNNDHNHSMIVCRSVDGNNTFMSLSYESLDVVHRDLKFDSYINARDLDLLGCCNGVVCLSKNPRKDDVLLWNPATRQKKFVLKPVIDDPCDSRFGTMVHGFGYDFRTNDYKVVRITSYVRDGHSDPFLQAMVYNLSTQSWRLIKDVITNCNFEGSRLSKTCLNGKFYVLVVGSIGGNSPKCFLLTFDIRDEVFVSTPLPEASDMKEYAKRVKVLKPLNGSVALITYFEEPSVKSFNISVLNEYGLDGSWTKLYSIGPFTSISCLLGFWKNWLVFENDDKEAIMWDLTTHELRKLHIPGFCSQFFYYKESLVFFGSGLFRKRKLLEAKTR